MNELKLITGNTPPSKPAHITPEDDAKIFRGILGEFDGVLTEGENLRAETIASNTLRIHSGVISIAGHMALIPDGDYIDVPLENGPRPGYKRVDLVMAKLSKSPEGDRTTIEVIKGAEGASFNEPKWKQGNIIAGDTYRYFKLYAIYFNGINIVSAAKEWQPLPNPTTIQKEYVKKIDSGWIEQVVGDGSSNASIAVRNLNGIIFIRGACYGEEFEVPNSGSVVATQLDSEWWPDKQVIENSNLGTPVQMSIDTYGTVRLAGLGSGSTKYWAFSKAYPPASSKN